MEAMVRRALADVCTVPVLIVSLVFKFLFLLSAFRFVLLFRLAFVSVFVHNFSVLKYVNHTQKVAYGW